MSQHVEGVEFLLCFALSVGHGAQSCCWVLQLAAASAGAGPECFRPVRSLRVQSLACPHLYLPRRCVLDATPPHRTPCWFPAFALGHKWFAPFGQGFPAPWWASRLRLEAEYTPLLRYQRLAIGKSGPFAAHKLTCIAGNNGWLCIFRPLFANEISCVTEACDTC